MAEIYKLRNHIKHYEWGSTDLIPRLLGTASEAAVAAGSPWAELWMGSQTDTSDGVSLGVLIADDPRRYLGEKTAERYGELPFLFKLLAAEKPLSIQAHPNLTQAREGFERENRAQIAPDAPNRNYRDPNHKPEIICALTPFTGMCGFRSPGEIARLLAAFLEGTAEGGLHGGGAPSLLREGFTPLLRALETPDTAAALRNFLGALFGFSQEAREALTHFILSAAGGDNVAGEGEEWELMREFARQHPGDPAIIAPLYLNVFHLAPSEAVFIDAGVPHAYIRGLGVELMANSDNVLRGGLTSKHVDVPELIHVLDFTPMQPRVIKPEPNAACYTYLTPCEEFSLMVMRGHAADSNGEAQAVNFARNTPAIVIVTEGEAVIEAPDAGGGGASGVILKQGESAFISASGDKEPLVLKGVYTLHAASVPSGVPGSVPCGVPHGYTA